MSFVVGNNSGRPTAYFTADAASRIAARGTPFVSQYPLSPIRWASRNDVSIVTSIVSYVTGKKIAWTGDNTWKRGDSSLLSSVGTPVWVRRIFKKSLHPLVTEAYLFGQLVGYLALGGTKSSFLRMISGAICAFPVVLPHGFLIKPELFLGEYREDALISTRVPMQDMFVIIMQRTGIQEIPARQLAFPLPREEDELAGQVIPLQIVSGLRHCLLCGTCLPPIARRTEIRYVLDASVVVKEGDTICNACVSKDGYIAISHTWGTTRPQLVGTRLVPWTVPLREEAKLAHLLKHGVPPRGLVWVDVLCIDQDSDYDKSAQIREMRSIFRGCQYSVAHLDNVALMHLISGLAKRLSVSRYQEPDEISIARLPREVASNAAKAIESIMADPWFQRVWTMQECFLPPSVLFVESRSGQLGATIDDLVCAGFVAMHFSDRSVDPNGVSWPAAKLGGTSSCHTEGAAFCIELSQERKCSKVADRLYGILGLLPYGKNVPVNYDVYPKVRHQDFLTFAIRNGDTSLLHFTGKQFANGVPLPSLDGQGGIIWLARPLEEPFSISWCADDRLKFNNACLVSKVIGRLDINARGDGDIVEKLALEFFRWLTTMVASPAQVASTLLWRNHERDDCYGDEATAAVAGLMFASRNRVIFHWRVRRLLARNACGGRVAWFFDRAAETYQGRWGTAVAYQGEETTIVTLTSADITDFRDLVVFDYGGRNWSGWTAPLLVSRTDQRREYCRLGPLLPVSPFWTPKTKVVASPVYLKGKTF
ncbi:heterokaryon incompatibility protein-domain-containing protein [Cladochytrium replicatum]|nr:heterokaryon incompatibility protein-domain-containing protein [Cladochytrium replicatum]